MKSVDEVNPVINISATNFKYRYLGLAANVNEDWYLNQTCEDTKRNGQF